MNETNKINVPYIRVAQCKFVLQGAVVVDVSGSYQQKRKEITGLTAVNNLPYTLYSLHILAQNKEIKLFVVYPKGNVSS